MNDEGESLIRGDGTGFGVTWGKVDDDWEAALDRKNELQRQPGGGAAVNISERIDAAITALSNITPVEPAGHAPDPVHDLSYPAHDNHWKCRTCDQPISWDGVFEGKWLH